MFTYDKHYDIIVVGAGHAGCEAALASARMGCRTLLLTIGLDNIAQMSCNPAIGGTAKGHLVREIDALGGEMGKVTDKTGIQFRMLNKSRGPAVWSLRAQCDKKAYQFEMKRVLESQDNLDVKQALVERLIVENGYVCGVETLMGVRFLGKAVILTTGTFLKGLIHIGLEHYPSGRAWEMPSITLSDCLKELGFEIGRLKTGTPPRLNGRTINFSELQIQPGDDPPEPFSFSTEKILQEQIPCYITYTNEKTHKIIRSGLDRSPLYSGVIKGIGPRYCPSIEDKVVRFPDKPRHQVFLEPEGRNTLEYYANGIPTSLPEDVQLALVRSIKGLENAEMMRPGYAIEYDFVFPTQLKPNLETKLIQNLFLAGQINGTSGYEEAAAQGIMAGINAVLKLRGEKPFILSRAQAYIGVLIDDLITKGTTEPYRMFTARAEHRLILRQDNADERLMHYGYQFGLISEEQYKKCLEKKEWIKNEMVRLEKTFKKPEEVNLLCPGEDSVSLAQLLRRPDIHYKDLALIDDGCKNVPHRFAEALEIQLKYDGYIERQMEQVEKFSKIEKLKIPNDIDYNDVHGLRTESRLKLSNIKPISIGQASRISGVSPSDISVLMIYIEKRRRLSKIANDE